MKASKLGGTILALSSALTACGGNATGARGEDGVAGTSVTATEEPPGENCPEGGFEIESEDAVLGYVCNGEDGIGRDGSDVTATPEPAGANCPEGGLRIESEDAVLGYVCNGEDGTGEDGIGEDGSDVTAIPEPAGANCAEGGFRIESDGELVGYLCNGSSGGAGAAADDVYVDAADAECSDGGPGTQSTPNCSIRAAVHHVAWGGTVHVAAGSYAGFTISRDMTLLGGYDASDWSRDPKANASLIRDTETTRYAVSIEPATVVTVDGFVIKNSGTSRGGSGIDSQGALTLRNNEFSFEQSSHGNLVIAFNHGYDTLLAVGNFIYAGDASATPGSDLRAFAYSGYSGVVIDNVIDGGLAADQSMALYINQESSGLFLHNTIVGGSSTGGGTVMTVGGNGDDGSVFINNLLVEGSTTGSVGIFQSTGENKTFLNNLLDGTTLVWHHATPVTDIVDFDTCAWPGCGTASGNVAGSAALVGGGDYHLTAASDAIGQGLDATSYAAHYEGSEDDEDHDGVARSSTTPDIGAYTYVP